MGFLVLSFPLILHLEQLDLLAQWFENYALSRVLFVPIVHLAFAYFYKSLTPSHYQHQGCPCLGAQN